MILALDFDGVIHEKDNPLPGRRMGAPLPDAAAALNALLNTGHTIIVHTVMATTEGGRQAVIDWLHYYAIPFHEVTAIKPNADVFLDDKAIRFTDWQQALIDISKLNVIDDIKHDIKAPKMRASTKRYYKSIAKKR